MSGSNGSPGPLVQINGGISPQTSNVIYGTTLIKSLSFNNPILSWSTADGNATNAQLTLYTPKESTTIKYAGMVWTASQTKPMENNFVGTIDPNHLQNWYGTYASSDKQSNDSYKAGGPVLMLTISDNSPFS